MRVYPLLRQIIDQCDDALRDSFLRRMEISERVAEAKMAAGEDIFDPPVATEIVTRIADSLPPQVALQGTALWTSLLRMSRGRQYRYFVRHDPELRLAHEQDITPDAPQGPVYCPAQFSVLVPKELCVQQCDTVQEALEQARKNADASAFLPSSAVYNTHWLLPVSDEPSLYINDSFTLGKNQMYLLVSRRLVDRPENNLISIAHSVNEHSGALAQALSVLADYNFSVEYLRLKREQEKTFIFVDFAGNITREETRSALYQLSHEQAVFKLLGYRKK